MFLVILSISSSFGKNSKLECKSKKRNVLVSLKYGVIHKVILFSVFPDKNIFIANANCTETVLEICVFRYHE